VSGLTVLFVILAVVLTVPVYAFAVRRLLGLRLSPLRAWIGGRESGRLRGLPVRVRNEGCGTPNVR
jgi:hypothetical protein